MATYGAITSGQIDSESPLDVTLAGQWTDNLLAVIEADVSAPDIANEALATYPIPAVDGVLGTWALIDSWAPPAVNSKDFTWDESLYSEVKIVIEGVVPAADNAILLGRVGYGNGSTFFAGAGDYVTYIEAIAAGVYGVDNSYPDTSIPLSHSAGLPDGVGTAAGEGFSGTFVTVGWNSLVSRPGYTATESYDDDGGSPIVGQSWGSVIDNASDTLAMDSFRIYWSTGNFEVAGKIYVYGLKVA